MLNRIVDFTLENRWMVMAGVIGLVLAGDGRCSRFRSMPFRTLRTIRWSSLQRRRRCRQVRSNV